jgi:hypothetical protein
VCFVAIVGLSLDVVILLLMPNNSQIPPLLELHRGIASSELLFRKSALVPTNQPAILLPSVAKRFSIWDVPNKTVLLNLHIPF